MMFENAEREPKVDKGRYEQEASEVRAALLEAQRELAEAELSVVVIVAGVVGAGKAETVDLLLEWLDARGVETHAMTDPTDEEQRRPPMWRFWRDLPPRGRMVIFFGAWYAHPILDRALGDISAAELDRQVERIVEFERMLHREDVLVVKLWLHLSREAEEARLEELSADPRQRWRVLKQDWKLFKHYKPLRRVAEDVLSRTNIAEVPWKVIGSADRRHRNLAVTKDLLSAMRDRLEEIRARGDSGPILPDHPVPAPVNVLNRLDLTLSLDRSEYEQRKLQAQGELARLGRRLRKQSRSLVLVLEGPDAAGKGGAIRRVTAAMDARNYQVISVSAPTDEERARPYLWRFWRHLPPAGRVTIFDRSWYGRILVERVEGYARPDQWGRAFDEINAFERQLTEAGTIVLKFWIAITPAEQLRRFVDRQVTPYKQYKLTAEDWRNRERWSAYEAAACEMIERTDGGSAPWVLVEGDDKRWARVKVLETIVRRLQDTLAD